MKGRWRLLPAISLLSVVAFPAIATAQTLIKPATTADYTALGALPDWSGLWSPERSGRMVSEPKYTPEAAKAAAEYKAAQGKGENLQTEQANCVPPGMPGIMRQPYPMEVIYSPGRVTLLMETYSQVRRIYTDGRALPDEPDPQFNGTSVGRWEGKKLIVETTGVTPSISILPGIHPSDKLRIHEVFEVNENGRLVDTATLTDPEVFTEPFVIQYVWGRHRDWAMREYICQENNRDAADPFGRPSMDLKLDPEKK
ncbi:MAG: hypothetical protein J0I80_07945 [Sphingomonas sp.]|nr:hypothetical protein [Sphingomonas sp.]